MAVQGLGYILAAGAEAEHCNGEGALRQSATTTHSKGGLGRGGGGGGGGGGGHSSSFHLK